MNRYSQSQLKTAKIDSVIPHPNGTLLYPFHTWMDTGAFQMPACNWKNGPSWMGRVINEMTNGTTWLFNASNDSIRIDHTAGLGSSWTMMQLASGGRIAATVDSAFMITLAGITDSVKQIRLQAFDQLGVADPTHPLTAVALWLSKDNGILKGFSFRELPGYLELIRIDSIVPNTFGQIYDFSIGDEFEYRSDFNNFTFSLPPAYQYIQITGKWYSAGMDTVFYSRSTAGMSFNFNSFPQPHLDTIFTMKQDTVFYTNLNTLLHQAVPEENTNLSLHASHDFGTYYLRNNPAEYNNRIITGETTSFITATDSCVMVNNFEPTFYTLEVAPGLGEITNIQDNMSIAMGYSSKHMIWFHKGSETYGNFFNIFVGMDEVSMETVVTIFPNPSAAEIALITPPNLFESVSLFAVDGKILSSFPLTDSVMNILLRDFPKGMLYLQLTGKSGTKLVKVLHAE